MNDTRLELLCERAEAGLASDEELAELEAWAAEDGPLSGMLREAVMMEAGDLSLTDAIMASVAAADLAPEDAELCGFADGQLDASAAERVAARLQRDPEARASVSAFAEVSTVLSAALAEERGPTPDLWPAVARQLGWDPEEVPGWSGQILREAVLGEAGSVNVAPAVLAAIRPAAPVPAAEPAVPAWRRWWQSLAMPALGFATAAALLLSFPSAPEGGRVAMMVDLSPVNHVQIEELSSDSPDAMVSVMQFDDDAPTIIFIDEISAEDEGATL